jgi:hypothetical protein
MLISKNQFLKKISKSILILPCLLFFFLNENILKKNIENF